MFKLYEVLKQDFRFFRFFSLLSFLNTLTLTSQNPFFFVCNTLFAQMATLNELGQTTNQSKRTWRIKTRCAHHILGHQQTEIPAFLHAKNSTVMVQFSRGHRNPPNSYLHTHACTRTCTHKRQVTALERKVSANVTSAVPPTFLTLLSPVKY